MVGILERVWVMEKCVSEFRCGVTRSVTKMTDDRDGEICQTSELNCGKINDICGILFE